MLIIFGIRSFVNSLAMLRLVCGRCHNTAAHRLVRRSRWFTLFFLPVLPLGSTHYTVCAFCGVAHKVSRADAELLRSGRATFRPSASDNAMTIAWPTGNAERVESTPGTSAGTLHP
jgi:zinc-ribbon family